MIGRIDLGVRVALAEQIAVERRARHPPARAFFGLFHAIELARLELAELARIEARLAHDLAEDVERGLELVLRDGDGEDDAIGGDVDVEVRSEGVDVVGDVARGEATCAAVAHELCDARWRCRPRFPCRRREDRGRVARAHDHSTVHDRERVRRDRDRLQTALGLEARDLRGGELLRAFPGGGICESFRALLPAAA